AMRDAKGVADVAVVGGGLAGLVAAVTAARGGARVVLLEKSDQVGGRATSRVDDGFVLNQGPHALYRHGAAAAILRELGVRFTGGIPDRGLFALAGDDVHPLPTSPLAM